MMAIKRSLKTAVLQLVVYICPTIPIYLFTRLMKAPLMTTYDAIMAALFAVSVVLHATGVKPRRQKLVRLMLVVGMWLPSLFFIGAMHQLFPGLIWVFFVALAGCALSLMISDLLMATLLRFGLIALFVLVMMILRFDITRMTAVAFVSGTVAVGFLEYLLEKWNGRLMPQMLFIPLLAILGTFGALACDTYMLDHPELAGRIAAQPFVTRVDRASIPERFNTSFFITYPKGQISFPRYLSVAVHVNKNGPVQTETLRGEPADEPVIDYADQAYYFVAGDTLYRGSLLHGRIHPLKSFQDQLKFNTFFQVPNHLREHVADGTCRLLIVFEHVSEALVYNLEEQAVFLIPTELRLGDAIWHPSGDRIIALGHEKSLTFVPQQMLLMLDLEGNELIRRRTDSLMADLATCDRQRFVLADFTGSRLEIIDMDTLKAIRSIRVSPGPRAVRCLNELGVVLVPSYVDGTISVYDMDDWDLLDRWLIGKRVRAVTETQTPGYFTVSSSSGMFILDVNQALEGKLPAVGVNE